MGMGIPFCIILIILLAGCVSERITDADGRHNAPEPTIENLPIDSSSAALKAGKSLSNNKCYGSGPAVLTNSPMEPEDFSIIIPYGAVIGGHVTPIDHQYFAPSDRNTPPDAYEVYAMADSRLVEIGTRTNSVLGSTEYRLV